MIEELAAKARQSLGFGLIEPISAMECMYRLQDYKVKAAGRELPVVYGVRELEPGVEGETFYNGGGRSSQTERLEIILSENTYDLLDCFIGEDPRARFSFFHELGHATLHAAELVRLSRIPRSQADAFMRSHYKDIRPYEDVEWQANAFSASMMMPFALLNLLFRQGRLNVAELCELLRVSRKSAEIRIRQFTEERQKY